jgi:hypothetical protein
MHHLTSRVDCIRIKSICLLRPPLYMRVLLLRASALLQLLSMHEADYLRTQMEIEFPSIFDVDIYEWKKANWPEFAAQDRAEKEHTQSKIRREK